MSFFGLTMKRNITNTKVEFPNELTNRIDEPHRNIASTNTLCHTHCVHGHVDAYDYSTNKILFSLFELMKKVLVT